MNRGSFAWYLKNEWSYGGPSLRTARWIVPKIAMSRLVFNGARLKFIKALISLRLISLKKRVKIRSKGAKTETEAWKIPAIRYSIKDSKWDWKNRISSASQKKHHDRNKDINFQLQAITQSYTASFMMSLQSKLIPSILKLGPYGLHLERIWKDSFPVSNWIWFADPHLWSKDWVR